MEDVAEMLQLLRVQNHLEFQVVKHINLGTHHPELLSILTVFIQ